MWPAVVEGLRALGGGADGAALAALCVRVRAEKHALVPNCALCAAPCGRTADYDMAALARASAEVRALKLRLLRGACALARDADPAAAGDGLVFKALYVLGEDWAEDWAEDWRLPVVQEVEARAL